MLIIDSEDFVHEGKSYRREIIADDRGAVPWEEEDGHGPVTDWTRRAKRPGELVLAEDRGARLLYDFSAACELARRDGWGWLPGELETKALPSGFMASCPGLGFSVAPDISQAISALFKKHRDSMSARAYAAGAAREDFEKLRRFCAGDWGYVGVRVMPLCACCDTPDEARAASLWGIESDSGDQYMSEVAHLLADEVPESENGAA